MIRENIGYKLLALAIAIFIWLYVNDLQPNADTQVRGNSYITRHFTVPLAVHKADPDFVISGVPRKVEIVLEGRLDDMRALAEQQDDISAYISLLGRRSGVHVLPIIIKLPEEFTGLIRRSAETHAMTVTLQEKIHRAMKVAVDLVGTPQPGYSYGAPEFRPQFVSISGPEAAVASVDRLMVKANLGGAGSIGIDDDLPVSAVDHSGQPVRGIELSRRTVHVRLLPVISTIEKPVLISVNMDGETPYPYRVVGVEAKPQTVAITGDAETLAGIGVVETEPIALTGRKQSFSQRVRLVAPAGVSFPKGDSVDVMIRVVPFVRQSGSPVEADPSSKNTNIK